MWRCCACCSQPVCVHSSTSIIRHSVGSQQLQIVSDYRGCRIIWSNPYYTVVCWVNYSASKDGWTRETVGLLKGGGLQRFHSIYTWCTACEPTAQLQVTIHGYIYRESKKCQFGRLILHTDKGYELTTPVNHSPLYVLTVVRNLGGSVVPFRNRSNSPPVAE